MFDPTPPPTRPSVHEPPGCGFRTFVVVSTVLPWALPLASLVAAVGWGVGTDDSQFTAVRSVCGMLLVAVGLLIGGVNLHVAFRPAIHRWRHGSMEGFKGSSVVPLVGNGFAVLGTLIGWGHWPTAAYALLEVVIDCGGGHWLLIALIRTRQF